MENHLDYEYFDRKRVKGQMVIGAKRKATDNFEPMVVALWLVTELAQYKRCQYPAALSGEAVAYLSEHEKPALSRLDGLSAPAQLVMEAVLLACEMPARSTPDENLSLIAAAYSHAQEISSLQVPKVRLKYSIRKHRDTQHTKLMTVYGDLASDLGLETTGLVLSALKGAVGRDLGVNVTIANAFDIFGDELYKSRPAPTYPDLNTFVMRTIVVDHIFKNLALPYVKDNAGGIAVISDYFESISTRP